MDITHNYKTPVASGTSGAEREADGHAASEKRWDDIVFENRNQEYGAYVLRKGYGNNFFVGLIITAVVLILLLFFPLIRKYLQGGDSLETAPPRKLIYTELTAPPPIDKPKPPPPQIQLPKLQKVIKFVPPKVVKEEVVEEIPTIQEIKQNETAAVETEGDIEVIFDEPVAEVVVEDENELFTVVQQMPEFEGGYEAMMNFIKGKMVYPPAARRMGVEGTVFVNFIVNKDGSISEPRILRGISTECDAEALRVVGMMPHWKPGKQNGRSVNVRFTLPLKFRLNSSF